MDAYAGASLPELLWMLIREMLIQEPFTGAHPGASL